MPRRDHGESGFSNWLLMIGVVVSLGVFYAWVQPQLDLATKIHAYLGTNHGTDPTKWTGLVGHIEAANAFHREQYVKIACSLWKLEHPGQPEPNPCPPGGPSSRPPSPPTYP